MEINKPRVAAYVGATAAVGVGFAALGGMRSTQGLALGLATGAVAGSTYALMQTRGGIEEAWLGASILGGATAGALMLRGVANPGLTPIAQRGVGAAIGGVVGLLGPLAAAVVQSQLDR